MHKKRRGELLMRRRMQQCGHQEVLEQERRDAGTTNKEVPRKVGGRNATRTITVRFKALRRTLTTILDATSTLRR